MATFLKFLQGYNLISWLVLIAVSTTVGGERLQKIRFYRNSNSDEVGGSELFTSKIETIPSTSIAYNAKSYCVEDGLWIITYKIGDGSPIKTWMGGNTVGKVCHNKPDERRIYISVRPVGKVDLETSALSLFPESRWESEEDELTIETDDYQLELETTFRSYVLTGTENYEIFPNANFEGDSLCLLANGNADSYLDYGITSNFSTSIKIGSSLRGCNDGGENENRTTPRSSATSLYAFYTSSAFTHLVNLVLLIFSIKIVT